MPEAYKAALDAHAAPSAPGQFQGGGGGHGGHREQQLDQRQNPYQSDPKAQAYAPVNNDPEYATPEESEAAFMKLLKRCGVQPDWTWEQAIRATARDPQFRAIRDPKDRKIAFEKYCHDVIIQDKERAKERLTKLRADFETMLKRHPEITHYTRWKTARPIIEGETIFRSTDVEAERRQLFEEYIIGLKRANSEEQATKRRSAMDGLVDLLPKLNLEPYTRWSDARGIISSTPPFQNDERYQVLSQLDILTVFRSHIKGLERAFNDSKQEAKNRKFRKERKCRDEFKELLEELRRDGKINATTTWSRLLPSIENDARYTKMLGQGGSTPQELFWDVVEEQERGLRSLRNHVSDVLQVCPHLLSRRLKHLKSIEAGRDQAGTNRRYRTTGLSSHPLRISETSCLL
jgi:pre-mRNA-processing factor 40